MNIIQRTVRVNPTRIVVGESVVRREFDVLDNVLHLAIVLADIFDPHEAGVLVAHVVAALRDPILALFQLDIVVADLDYDFIPVAGQLPVFSQDFLSEFVLSWNLLFNDFFEFDVYLVLLDHGRPAHWAV